MAGCLGDLAGKLLEKRLIHGVKAGEHGIGGEVAHILEPVLDGLAAEYFGLILPLLDDVVERRRGRGLGLRRRGRIPEKVVHEAARADGGTNHGAGRRGAGLVRGRLIGAVLSQLIERKVVYLQTALQIRELLAFDDTGDHPEELLGLDFLFLPELF